MKQPEIFSCWVSFRSLSWQRTRPRPRVLDPASLLTLASCCSEAKPRPKTVLARLSAHWPNFCDVFVKVMFGVMVLLIITWQDKVTIRGVRLLKGFLWSALKKKKEKRKSFLFLQDKWEENLQKLQPLFPEQRTMPYCHTVHTKVNLCRCSHPNMLIESKKIHLRVQKPLFNTAVWFQGDLWKATDCLLPAS